ncbi:PREDICTED: C-type lectin 37Db-like [Drosophila arizonae]|uniref:C-type lectin 37Db-like n=1 Tax=Drosophila arizonae TaxID=7263 RepID=A0ABM1NRN5_DROAR|nr:PREDICTED: C-type lectin 37Db-like [Drosophila arizonae]
MNVKIVVLLISMQLGHFAMSHETPNLFAQKNELGKCVSSCGDFPIKIGSKLYYIETKLKENWFSAAESCRRWGGYLLNIESATEMELIVSITNSDRFWVSANCLAQDRQFISIATGVAMPYSSWQPGQPDNLAGNEYCVKAAKAGLSDEPCETRLNYVCQANIL